MPILKVIEIMTSSPKSWEDAAVMAVQHVGETVKEIRSVYLNHLSAVVKENKITEYRVNAKITFEVVN
jgi:flavin-binding protein dodecin